MLIYFFQIKYTEAILLNSTRTLLWFENTKLVIAVKEKKVIVSFITFSGILSFLRANPNRNVRRAITGLQDTRAVGLHA